MVLCNPLGNICGVRIDLYHISNIDIPRLWLYVGRACSGRSRFCHWLHARRLLLVKILFHGEPRISELRALKKEGVEALRDRMKGTVQFGNHLMHS